MSFFMQCLLHKTLISTIKVIPNQYVCFFNSQSEDKTFTWKTPQKVRKSPSYLLQVPKYYVANFIGVKN